MDPKAVAQLMDMGVSRPAAISALRACKGDINEAAVVVFDPLHADATLDEDAHTTAPATKPTTDTSITVPTTPLDGGSVPDDEDGDEGYDQDSDESGGDDGMHDDIDFFGNEVEEIGADPFAQISFQKDRKVVMVEIEEAAEKVKLTINRVSEPAYIMPQGEWMKGCAEGNEQSVSGCLSLKQTDSWFINLAFVFKMRGKYLFQIYSRLTETQCICPADKCSGTIRRQRTDFFAIPVRASDL